MKTLKDEVRLEQRRLKYDLFSESENNLYAEAVELTHKLHWFQEAAGRLRKEQERTHDSAKTEEGRALQLARGLTPTPRALPAQPSPVAYFHHPHLHRLARP